MLPGEDVDVAEFEEQNTEMLEAGKTPAEGQVILLGITKASLATDSFLSAASFRKPPAYSPMPLLKARLTRCWA